MAKIYLSSTYTDLKVCREAVYHALREMRHDVIAMEDYVATDQRPIEKCLADVANSDLYIGIFAWRYGYIPSHMNPEHKSITELEYRKAIQTGKMCLLFLLDEEASWPRKMMDEVTGEGHRGECIKALRRELSEEKIISFFQTAEELARLVSTAVSNWTLDSTNLSPHTYNERLERVQREERLKALIIDHRGFIQSRLESFVGREQELATLRQDISLLLPTGGYLTITGQAGQGKSSIIAELVREYGLENVAFHFIPFNPGPDHQVGLLRNLMARLILKYRLSEIYVASESRPALREYFPKVLGEIKAKDGQEVIFIDGLDQLEEDFSGVRDLSFLPNNPPPGIVFVLGTRPNDTLRPLELLKPRFEYKLPNLSRQDFDLILQHRQVQLDTELANRFYKAMQENALYLDLVARELTGEKASTPEEIIQRIADNPENIFSLSMERLMRQTTQWEKIIYPVLGLLLATREPLSVRHIALILEIEEYRLKDGLARLGGLIAEDGQQRYSLFHLKLQDYLRQNESNPNKRYLFAKHEEENWHLKLANWCEQNNVFTIWQDAEHNTVEQRRREYARQHHITHLYYAHAWQRLFKFLDNEQYGQAKMQYDPSMRSYTQDLDMGRQAAVWEEWTVEEGVALLSHLWRYTILLCSLTSRAETYTPEAFEALLMLRRVQEAVGLAELLTQQDYKADVLLQIAKHLGKQSSRKRESLQFLQRSFEITRSLEKHKGRLRLLKELSIEFSEAQQWEQTEAVARTIEERDDRAEALRELGTALVQAQLWEHAEAVARSLEWSVDRAEALRELGTALVQAQQWEHAEAVARSLEMAEDKAKALRELGTALVQAQQWERAEALWTLIAANAEAIKNRENRVEALQELVRVLKNVGKYEQILHLVQYSWRQADTREYAIKLLPLAFSLISLKPEIGTAFCDAFGWVDILLGG